LSRLIAIDWDQNQIYVVAADIRGNAVKVQRALTWQEEQPPSAATADELGRRLRERLKEAGVAPAPLLGCVSRERLVVKDIRFPAVPDVEEPAVVRFQTVKELTDSPDDVVIDYVARASNGEVERRASVVVVQKKLMQTYQAVAAAAGLKLAGLSPRLMGAISCLRRVMGTTVVTPPPDPADGTVMLVLVGEKQAEIGVMRNGHFLLTRSINAGPNLASEVKRNLAVHEGQMPDHPVVAVYLTGRGAGELRERLKEMVEVPVHTFDPFAGGEVGQMPPGNRGPFAGPMGLLYLKAGGELPLNWVSPRQPKPPADPNFARMRFWLVAGIALLVGLFVMGQLMIAAEEGAINTLNEQIQDVDGKLKAARENGKRLKALQDWANPTWLDEVYELAGRTDLKRVLLDSIDAESLPRDPKTPSKYVGQLKLQGKLLEKTNESRRAAFEHLRGQFSREGYYSIDTAQSKFDDQKFTLVVKVIRRAPGDYRTQLDDPTVVKDKDKSKAPTKTKSSKN
jgi:Tfp pilus assembly PilM family ATPase